MSTLWIATSLLLGACAATPAPPATVAATPAGNPTAPAAAAPTAAAPPAAGPDWEPMRGLLGTWQGNDPARHTTGRFTLAPDLGGKILVRRNVDDTPQGRHEDLMIVFRTPGGLRASYYDNEGHVISYAITATADRVELISDDVAGAPRFKLSYDIHGADELAIDFAIAMPGSTEFKHYTGGTVHRVGG
jgi:hypothetical protein